MQEVQAYFFFSSRRRHTRCLSDWSSDVCSSDLLKIAQKHGAALAIDDAHAVGVLGPRGDGTAAHYDLSDDVDLIVGTFSKSLASIGGVVAGPAGVMEFLRYNARPPLFTAALPPSNTAGVLAP